ncbi:MFS transporter [Candidatus Woesearchaeota archaeon]|jgi:MFS family permease|nr:MFS transporter [Candidatus Woesearchaeota archaeon]MBT4698152.1 MFS transporter [Candidatus Woesearchaeota archaeon]MBT4716367.1 MFS transporter [Candidatus Woesearchaeota archaeon]MBT7930291.1 MFS transporter [Candidatus Woesearchaeota archaeon]
MTLRKKALEANIWKYYALGFIRMFMLIMPIIVIFFQENGLNMAEVMILQAAFSVTVAIMELPSGFLADVLTRKTTLIIGFILSFLGFLSYSLSYSFLGFLIAEIVLGFGSSFISGTDSALMYDTLIEIKKEKKYKEIEGKAMMFRGFAEATAAIIGGLLAIVSLRLPFVIESCIMFFCIPLAFMITEPKRKRFSHKKGYAYGLYKILRFALYKNKNVKWLIIYSSIISTCTLVAVWFYQPYFQLVGLPLVYFGITWAAINFSVGIFSKYAYDIEKKLGKRNSFLILIPLIVVAYLIMGNVVFLPSILCVIIFAFVRGLSNPVMQDYINQVTYSDKRATVMSLKNLVGRIIFVIFSPFIGWFADVYTIPVALSLSAAFALVFGGVAIIFLRKHEVI